MNFFHQIKLFDINIDHFGGLNQCQRHFSLYIVGIWWFLSLLFQSRTKKITKISFYTKIKLKKKLR
jgi:hypothetical protein